MGLQPCTLNLDDEQQELQPHGTLGFPCAAYLDDYTAGEEYAFPLHWHEELEMLYLASGTMELKTSRCSIAMQAGDFVAVNAGVLHGGITRDGCVLHSLVFHPSLITGSAESAFATKYLSPLLNCAVFRTHSLHRERDAALIQGFSEAVTALEEESVGFEFLVRARLSDICLALYQHFRPEIETKTAKPHQEEARVQAILQFIHTNYAKDISLQDLACSADISTRECLRCFQRTIQISPMRYLLRYRIRKGAEALLNHPSHSIAEIATFCGFDSPSNFSQMFKRYYACTPREYRKKRETDAAGA